ncbi:hypothetical protein BDZ91DRAFT_812317 [Kalaharituber pfeilii]|nr:hypothetical protein BDZ91DRAFT_812317 [Kalaharituber pfeilii]
MTKNLKFLSRCILPPATDCNFLLHGPQGTQPDGPQAALSRAGRSYPGTGHLSASALIKDNLTGFIDDGDLAMMRNAGHVHISSLLQEATRSHHFRLATPRDKKNASRKTATFTCTNSNALPKRKYVGREPGVVAAWDRKPQHVPETPEEDRGYHRRIDDADDVKRTELVVNDTGECRQRWGEETGEIVESMYSSPVTCHFTSATQSRCVFWTLQKPFSIRYPSTLGKRNCTRNTDYLVLPSLSHSHWSLAYRRIRLAKTESNAGVDMWKGKLGISRGMNGEELVW